MTNAQGGNKFVKIENMKDKEPTLKKVLVAVPDFSVGGGQKMAAEIVHHIEDGRIQFKIVSLYPKTDSPLDVLVNSYKLDIVYLNKKTGFDWGTVRDLRRVLKEFKPDVVHAHLRVMAHILPAMVGIKVDRKFYTVHNLAEKDGAGFNRYILKFAFTFAGFIPVAISGLCRKSIADFYHMKEPDIPCVYVGMDLTAFKRTRAYSDLPDQCVQFVAVGRFTVQKNYILMLRAFEAVNEHFPNTCLKIIGVGETFDEVKKYISDHNMGDAVELTGSVPDVMPYLDQSHIYLMSSDWEGLPQTVLEAMAMGLPIVSTKAGGVSDVVQEGENGLLVECGDMRGLIESMEKLIQSKKLRNQFSEKSLLLSSAYSIEKCSEEYRKLYIGR